jgi:hypothetical protein
VHVGFVVFSYSRWALRLLGIGTAAAIAVMLLAIGAPRFARAQPSNSAEDTFAVEPDRGLTVDAGVLVASPAILTGALSTGIGIGVTRRCGCLVEYGAQLGWSTASGESTSWSVTHSDLRLRVVGGLRRDVGRGALSLRMGLGTTVVHETRERNQGERAGLTGDDLMTSAWRAIPAGDVEAVVSLHLAGRWLAVVGGGPALYLVDGNVHAGWTAQLGVAWQP